MLKDLTTFIRNVNPLFVVLFPILVLPAMIYYMVRPWILMDDMVERNVFMGMPMYRPEAQRAYIENMKIKKIADEKEFADRSAETIRREAAERAEEKARWQTEHPPS